MDGDTEQGMDSSSIAGHDEALDVDINVDQSSNSNFDNMLNNIMGKSADLEEDDEVMKALMDAEQPVELGPAVSVHVADAYNKAASRVLSKDTNDKIRQGIRVPENCTTFRVPRLNPEIWQHLPSKARMTDIRSQKTQAGFSTAMCVLASISDEIAKNAKQLPKEFVGKLLKLGIDGANLIGTQFQEITQRRRLDVKPYMHADYAGICNSELPPSEFLFGKNLAESLKSSKAAASVIRNSTQGANRFRPYQSQSRGSSLNYQRPFLPYRGRWNGQQQQSRGRASSFRPQFNRNSTTFHPQQFNRKQ